MAIAKKGTNIRLTVEDFELNEELLQYTRVGEEEYVEATKMPLKVFEERCP